MAAPAPATTSAIASQFGRILLFDPAKASRKRCAQEIVTTLDHVHSLCADEEESAEHSGSDGMLSDAAADALNQSYDVLVYGTPRVLTEDEFKTAQDKVSAVSLEVPRGMDLAARMQVLDELAERVPQIKPVLVDLRRVLISKGVAPASLGVEPLAAASTRRRKLVRA